MREFEQHAIFLREHIMLPEGIGLSGETICEGWVVSQSGDAPWLDKTIRGLGEILMCSQQCTGKVDMQIVPRMQFRERRSWLFVEWTNASMPLKSGTLS